MKSIEKKLIVSKDMHPQLLRELEIHIKYCNHENILQCLGCFEDEQHYYLLMEFAIDGTCANLLEKTNGHRLSEPKSADITR